MKKLLSILLALALCLTFSVFAFAEDAEDVPAEVIDSATTGDDLPALADEGFDVDEVVDSISDFAEAVGNDAETIKDATDSLNEALSGVTTQADVNALISKIKDYAAKAGVSTADLGGIEDIIAQYSDDAGFNRDAFMNDLMDPSSPLYDLVKLYIPYANTPDVPTTTPEDEPEAPTEVPNPPTGENATGAIAALSVLAVAAAAFVVCTKKKED